MDKPKTVRVSPRTLQYIQFLNILDSSLTQPELLDKIVKEYINLLSIEIPKQLKD